MRDMGGRCWKKTLIRLVCLVLIGMMVLPGKSVLAATETKVKNGWVNETYYIKGKKAEGERRIKEEGKWHDAYFVKGKKQTGFVKIKKPKKTCYYDENGWRVSGVRMIKGKWYAFRASDGAMKTGWVTHKKLGGDVYYNSKGQRLLGTHKLYGVKYKFNKKTGVLRSKRYTVTNAIDNKAGRVIKKIGNSLRAAYKWSKMRWVRGSVSGSAGVSYFAKKGLTDHYGNCYVMAGTFCALARQLGYETYQVTGYVPSARGGITPHSWCDIKVNGVWYICDPDFEHETGRNGYLIKYGTSGTWRKISYSRMGN